MGYWEGERQIQRKEQGSAKIFFKNRNKESHGSAWGEYDSEEEQEQIEEETAHLCLMTKTDDEGESFYTQVYSNNIEEEINEINKN